MMAEILNFISNLFLLIGTIFFVVGTIGVIRFFDLYTRLHALTKVDNIGLGFILFGMILKSGDIFIALKLVLIWIMVLLSSSTLTYILSSHSNKSGEKPKLGEIDNDH